MTELEVLKEIAGKLDVLLLQGCVALIILCFIFICLPKK